MIDHATPGLTIDLFRPVVRQTYGSKVPRSSSSSSLIFEDISASSLAWRSSSPPSSSFIGILPPSSPPEWTGDRSRDSSPLFPEAQEDGVIPACPGHSDQDSEDDDECDGGSRSVQQKKLRSGVNAKAPAVQSTIRGFFTPLSRKKRPLHPAATVSVLSSSSQSPSHLRAIHLPPSKSTISKSSLTQLHLTHLPLLHTCKECGMSFVRGSEDEGLHRKHHARVMRGIIWDGLGQGRHKGKGRADGGWRVVRDGVSFGAEKGKGKIVVCDGSWGGSKVSLPIISLCEVLNGEP